MAVREDGDSWGHSGTTSESRCCYTLRLGCRKDSASKSAARLGLGKRKSQRRAAQKWQRCYGTKVKLCPIADPCIYRSHRESKTPNPDTLDKNKALLSTTLIFFFFLKSLACEKMEPQFDSVFHVHAAVQESFPSRKQQEIKEGYLEIYFKINNVSKFVSETFYTMKFI